MDLHIQPVLEIMLQVSAFGDDTGTDTGDVWTVHGYNAKDKIWHRDADIELKCVVEQLSCRSGHSATVWFHCQPVCKSVPLHSLMSSSATRIRHEDTGVLLASGSRKYGRPISGQQEVCGKKKQVGLVLAHLQHR